MVEERGGWFVVNVRDAKWRANPSFGTRVSFEMEGRFPETGIGIHVLEPGKPNCRYHREGAQEDFLVLSGECLLLVNGEERHLKAWDFVHCPAGVSHVFIGAGDRPCTVLMVGHRPDGHQLFYPESEHARTYGAEAPEPTPDPRVAYSDVERWQETDPGTWPPSS